MAVNRPSEAFHSVDPYEVSRAKIAEFADAIGDPNPVFRDPEAARTAGYPDVIAPITFPIVIQLAARAQIAARSGYAASREFTLHVEQRYEYSRPVYAGDLVICRFIVSRVGGRSGNVLVRTQIEMETVDGEHICTAFSTMAHRGGTRI